MILLVMSPAKERYSAIALANSTSVITGRLSCTHSDFHLPPQSPAHKLPHATKLPQAGEIVDGAEDEASKMRCMSNRTSLRVEIVCVKSNISSREDPEWRWYEHDTHLSERSEQCCGSSHTHDHAACAKSLPSLHNTVAVTESLPDVRSRVLLEGFLGSTLVVHSIRASYRATQRQHDQVCSCGPH